MPQPTDRELSALRDAIRLSEEARKAGNMPFGAVLLAPDGAVLASTQNTIVTGRDLTAHGAEHSTVTTAERAALIRFREWRKLTPDAPDLSAVIEAAIAAHGAAQSTITVSEAVRQRLDDARACVAAPDPQGWSEGKRK